MHEKDDIIDNIIYNKYDILEDHFDDKCKNKIPEFQQERFDNYRNSLDDENKTTMTNLKNGIELTIINNTLINKYHTNIKSIMNVSYYE